MSHPLAFGVQQGKWTAARLPREACVAGAWAWRVFSG